MRRLLVFARRPTSGYQPRDRVGYALEQLPLAQRQTLELAYFQGLTYSEIGAATGKTLGTVKTRLRLGLSKLRSLLQFSHLG